jgi:hypothetical protein
MTGFGLSFRKGATAGLLALLALTGSGTGTALAQVQPIDPNAAIDGDLASPRAAPAPAATAAPVQTPTTPTEPAASPASADPAAAAAQQASSNPVAASQADGTYKQDDLIGAAEGVFGKGAQGLAGLVENLLSRQGEPNAYIVGREGGGALVVGLRYGSGTLYHKIEGQRPVYWTGPSIGFDAGANAGNTFVLVYNLYNTDDLYRRFPAGEGQLYVVGGFNASYMRRGDIVLIPIRVGAGLRLGVNAGYMRFSTHHRWFPL